MAIKVLSMTLSTGAHTGIGQLSDVPVANASRVDVERIVKACIMNHLFHYSLGGRAAAYISEANEQQSFLGLAHF